MEVGFRIGVGVDVVCGTVSLGGVLCRWRWPMVGGRGCIALAVMVIQKAYGSITDDADTSGGSGNEDGA